MHAGDFGSESPGPSCKKKHLHDKLRKLRSISGNGTMIAITKCSRGFAANWSIIMST